MPKMNPVALPPFPADLKYTGIRATYYTSVVGDDPLITEVQDELWRLRFTPQVFKKDRQTTKAKGVDISLTKDMLSHAFNRSYEAAILVAGDGDYVPLVEEVKRLGKIVYLCFFEHEGLSPHLRRSADEFFDITQKFIQAWKEFPDHQSS